MRLAYLTTQYPKVSHTFIRRELLEIERRGHQVLRLAIRAPSTPLVDPIDQSELAKTTHCLSQPIGRLLIAQIRTICTRPLAFCRALRTAVRMGHRSDRGLLRHLAYLVEACYLLWVMRRHDVEHVHVHLGGNATAVARLIRSLGGPGYSFTVHGPDEFDAPRGISLAGKIADAAFVVAITDYCSAQMRRWTPLDHWSKIHVVRCGVGDGFLSDAVSPVSADSSTLVCVGRLCPQKGQLLLIEALAEVLRSGVTCHLVLAGDGEMRAVIERRIEEVDLNDHVEITGWIDEAQVRQRILTSRALVLPSFAEGLPVVIMEAMALGRPVISTYVAGIPELVVPGQTGWLVPSGNCRQLAATICEVMTAPVEVLRTMGTQARDSVVKRHHVVTEAAKLEALFTEHTGL